MRITSQITAPVSEFAETPRLPVERPDPVAEQPRTDQEKARPSETAEERLDLERVVETMNEAVRIFNHSLRFEVSDTHRVIIRVIDGDSGEIIRQIPPEELLDAFRRIETAVGFILDRKV